MIARRRRHFPGRVLKSHQLSRFYHVINSDKVFGTHTNTDVIAVVPARPVRGVTCPKRTRRRRGRRMAFEPNSTKRVGVISKDWARDFDDPIPLPRGRQLVTL